MIWVSLQSESPRQRNDAITFFIYLCVSLYQEFFLRNRLREFMAGTNSLKWFLKTTPGTEKHKDK